MIILDTNVLSELMRSKPCPMGCETTSSRTLYDVNYRGRNLLWN
jgi:predicted nucleic acid-binding protein